MKANSAIIVFKEYLIGKKILKALEESDTVFKWLEGQDPMDYLDWYKDYDGSCELMGFILNKDTFKNKYYITYKVINYENIENIFKDHKNIYFFNADSLCF